MSMKSLALNLEKAESFYNFVIKGIFLVKRARSDLEPSFEFLLIRVKSSVEEDLSKLVKILRFLRTTKSKILTLEAYNICNLHWYLDTLFAAH